MIRCPICEKQFDPATSPAMPFCSDRCRQIDPELHAPTDHPEADHTAACILV